MNDSSTTFGLSVDALAGLFRIGAEQQQAEESLSPEEKRNELLCDWLATSLPLERALARCLPEVVRVLREQLAHLAGTPFGELLQNGDTDLELLKKIKQHSKDLAASAKSEIERDVATAGYYAAIASGLVFHNEKLTTFSYEGLYRHFSRLAGCPWLTKDLAELIRKAQKICARRAGKK